MELPLRFIRAVTAALFPLFFAVPVLADVILVDQSGAPDADYTDLPPAFAAANHNDLILVRAGTYSSFSTDKGVRVLGVEEGVYVDGISTIHSLHFTKKFVMTNTRPDGLIVDACRGHVALESLHEQISWPYSKLTDLKITGSDDVRLRRCWIRGTVLGGSGGPWDEHWGDPAVEVINSEVEFVACNIYGAFDWDAENAAGGVGLFAGGSSRVRLSLTNVRGGDGSDGCNSWQRTEGGMGAPGLHITGDAEVVVTGSGSQLIEGGSGGWGCGVGSHSEGPGAPAIWTRDSAQVRLSGVILQPGEDGYGSGSFAADIDSGDRSVVEHPPFPDPTLEMIGDVIPGQVLTMRVTGPVGGNVRFFLGRIPEINYLSGSIGPDLLVAIRTVNPGLIDAGGVRDYDFVIPGNLSRGMYFLGQASVVYQGTTYRTPSQVVLIR